MHVELSTPDRSSLRWRKSSRSTQENCVEVAVTPSLAAVRDSKDAAGPTLLFTRRMFTRFLLGLS